MKRIICLLTAFIVCLSLCGCGSKGNPDHEYIVSLLEKGEYDMAIELVENLKAREVADSTEVPTESSQPKEVKPTKSPEPEEVDPVKLASDISKNFMKKRGKEMQKDYKKLTGQKPVAAKVEHAMLYTLDDYDFAGHNARFMMVAISGSFAYSHGATDSVYLAYDIDNDVLINSLDMNWAYINNFDGNLNSHEQFHTIATNAYASYCMYSGDFLWRDSETKDELDAASIALINDAIK